LTATTNTGSRWCWLVTGPSIEVAPFELEEGGTERLHVTASVDLGDDAGAMALPGVSPTLGKVGR
jgi:hypothetical protein